MPKLDRVSIYPIKSLDGLVVSQAEVLSSGALRGDREFAIVDAQGNFVNAKRNPSVHLLRARFDLVQRFVYLNHQNSDCPEVCFHLDERREAIAAWLSEFFGMTVQIVQNLEMGFPDDPKSPGPTVVSTASLQAVADWFPELTLDQTRLRFRTNLEFGDVPAFWEDRLFSTEGNVVKFQIGNVRIHGINPCQRCPVPTRDPLTGEVYANFQKIFVSQRRETLPTEVERSRFNHFYRLTVNTQIPASEAGKILRVGDAIEIL
ncbi:MOSC N-terminal beta barrel domain-containing protein [Tumidithrix elongata RA019]|uniref:MOSC N-terminal beta barrel domain-containing protein n=1 Tax=Tumidithrix elongata BACA0141 TaxID=2716417 RepID=A0AAW9PZU2_9CYAN|nr:MOSC N-terminal beta barrel domain-containing protein [Tumidithrix elongata RA019]